MSSGSLPRRVLDCLGPLSQIFESNMPMAYDVVPTVEKIANLDAKKDEDVDEAIDSYLRKFSIRGEDDLITIEAKCEKAGHERQKVVNREYTEIELDMNYAEQEWIKHEP